MDPSIVENGACAELDVVSNGRRVAYEAARRRWPSIDLTFGQFEGHLDRLGWTTDLPPDTDAVYLCGACSLGLKEACPILEEEYFPAVRRALALRYRRADLVEEVLQQARERLLVGPCPRIGTYQGRGSLLAWLQRVARRLALDLHRREKKNRHVTLEDWRDDQPGPAPDPLEDPDLHRASESGCLVELERALLDALHALSAGERQLLYMHYVQQLGVDQIAQCLGIVRSTVYRRLHHIESRIRSRSVAGARKRTGIRDRAELETLFRKSYTTIHVDSAVWLVSDRTIRVGSAPRDGESADADAKLSSTRSTFDDAVSYGGSTRRDVLSDAKHVVVDAL